MVRPLTKQMKNGEPYLRRAVVEKSIAEVLLADPATWTTRAAILDPIDPHFLHLEVLVHLIRYELSFGNQLNALKLLTALGKRCLSNLLRKVKDTALFDAGNVRDEVIGQLYELFAEDLRTPSEGTLDYYEINFNHALAALRISVIREETAILEPLLPLARAIDDEDTDDEIRRPVDDIEDSSSNGDVIGTIERDEFRRLIQALPAGQREAMTWKYVYGFDTESVDPLVETVATKCQISGRAARNRLRDARARLKDWIEEKRK